MAAGTRDDALAAADRLIVSGEFARDLGALVSRPTPSPDATARPALSSYLTDALMPRLARMGFRGRLLPNPEPGAPEFLLAERIEGDGLPTVLLYGHGDVVPGMEGAWSEGLSPWCLTERDGAWYGRGTADNKGQHAVNMAALDAVIGARGGRLGFNIRWLFEMGEEIGSPGLRALCRDRADLLGADLLIGSDGPRLSRDLPTLYLGSRGVATVEIACAPRDAALHSGNWGGVMRNPATVLANALASLVDRHGRLMVDALRPRGIPAPVRRALSRIAVDDATMGRRLDAGWGEPGLSMAERLLGWNTLEVLTLHAGNPDAPVNAIPPAARARCQLRFVRGTDPDILAPAIAAHLRARGFADVTVTALGGSPATRLDPDHPWVAWASDAVAEVLGRPPAINPNLGGTVPNDAFADILGLPTIWVPHSYPGCGQHGPDEHLPIDIARQGLAMMVALFWALGAGDTSAAGRTGRTDLRAG